MFLFPLAFIPSLLNLNFRLGFSTLILAILFASGIPLWAAEKFKLVPCDIKLVFSVDNNGMSVVSYDLEMQIHNQEGRTIHGVSVHWLNAQNQIIGNSDATCGTEHTGVELAQSGPCRRTIQKIGGRLLEQLGQETWTRIINSQMYNFQDVKYCNIIGYRFGKPSVSRY